MKVFHPSGSYHTILVTPGYGQAEVPSDWKDQKGNLRRFDVKFDEDGMADVDSRLGEYLIENGYGQRTRLKRVFNKLVHA